LSVALFQWARPRVTRVPAVSAWLVWYIRIGGQSRPTLGDQRGTPEDWSWRAACSMMPFRSAVLLGRLNELAMQVAGLMIPPKLAQRCLVQLRQDLAQHIGFGVAGSETL